MGMGAVELGKLIRDARLRRGWQQQELADRIGVDRGYISTIENGKRNWPQQYVPAIADALGLDQTDMAIAAGLITGIRRSPPAYDADSAHIARVIARWTPAQRKWLLDLMERTDAMLGDEPNGDDAATA